MLDIVVVGVCFDNFYKVLILMCLYIILEIVAILLLTGCQVQFSFFIFTVGVLLEAGCLVFFQALPSD